MAKLKKIIQLNKSENGHAENASIGISYEVHFNPISQLVTPDWDSLKLFCYETQRVVNDDMLLKSTFLKSFIRNDSQKTSWYKMYADLQIKVKLETERFQDNIKHSISH